MANIIVSTSKNRRIIDPQEDYIPEALFVKNIFDIFGALFPLLTRHEARSNPPSTCYSTGRELNNSGFQYMSAHVTQPNDLSKLLSKDMDCNEIYPLKAQGVWTKHKCVIKYKFYNFFEVCIKEVYVKHKK